MGESGRRAGGSGIHHNSECQEGWESWGEMAQCPPASGGVEEAVAVGDLGLGLSYLCWGCVWE